MKNNLPFLTVVFPNLEGEKKDLSDLFISIKNSNYPKEKLETIMVDNGSKDNSVSYVLKKFPWVKVIKLAQNYGFAKACNIGIKKAKGEYIFITNNDVVLEKDCLYKLINFISKQPDIGVVGPKTYFKGTKNKIALGALKYNFYTGRWKIAKNTKKSQPSDWVAGSGMLFRKKLWLVLDGFDEGFFFIFEDLDFCLRARKLGLKSVYYPEAVLWHKEGGTVNRPNLLHLKYFEGYKSKLCLLLKHASLLQVVTAFFLQFFVFAPYRLLILREESLFPLFKAAIWNLKNLPKTLAVRKKIHEVKFS